VEAVTEPATMEIRGKSLVMDRQRDGWDLLKGNRILEAQPRSGVYSLRFRWRFYQLGRVYGIIAHQ
jgi:hypothetical protein